MDLWEEERRNRTTEIELRIWNAVNGIPYTEHQKLITRNGFSDKTYNDRT
jgi:hypothetical protein